MVLAGLYVAIIIACFVGASSAGGDTKGRFVFLQLPLALQMVGLHALGLRHWLHELGWVEAYLWIGLPTLVLFYAAGCGLGYMGRFVLRAAGRV
ncbi:MAG: hypothetical protein IE913_11505 [Halothiobacillus sp.]|nr:hypothetical protein [Halothiobacillus sp.]